MPGFLCYKNTLVYLSNAVEKFCRETGFQHEGVSRYICTVEQNENMPPLADILDAFYSCEPVRTVCCEPSLDAYEAIVKAHEAGQRECVRNKDWPEKQWERICRMIEAEYETARGNLDYQYFLGHKFPWLKIIESIKTGAH